ncbi:MAG: hypothetical protein J0I84_20190 [Terrimonas sp.]|nr:hypothetical protein [Terrimonas sp.]
MARFRFRRSRFRFKFRRPTFRRVRLRVRGVSSFLSSRKKIFGLPAVLVFLLGGLLLFKNWSSIKEKLKL